jgi:acyl-CoA synthetase (AMP-forming)/AMP-acid ligase II
VFGVPNALWGTEVACMYVGDLEPSDLEARLRMHMSGPLIPKRWRKVDSLPMTDLGKPDRHKAIRLLS